MSTFFFGLIQPHRSFLRSHAVLARPWQGEVGFFFLAVFFGLVFFAVFLSALEDLLVLPDVLALLDLDSACFAFCAYAAGSVTWARQTTAAAAMKFRINELAALSSHARPPIQSQTKIPAMSTM